jgi:surface-anchored protein
MKSTSALLILALSSTASHAASIFSADHGDFGIAYDGGALDLHYHLGPDAIVDGIPVGNDPDGAEFAPDAILTLVPEPAASRPAGAAWDFLGSPASAPIWFLPQSEDPQKPFFGIGSEELDPADWSSLSLRLTAMSAPASGNFSLYQTNGFGSPIVQITTANGIDGSDSFNLSIGGHAHHNWAFTAPGRYDLSFTASGIHLTDGPVSGSGTFSFIVIPEPAAASLSLATASLLLFRRRRI